MSFRENLARIRQAGDWTQLPSLVPFARMLGLQLEVRGETLTCKLPFEKHLIGNPVLPALHGGAVGGFLECAGILHLLWSTDTLALPKTVGVTVDYLLSSRAHDTYANAHVVKLGKRVSHLRIEAWQTRPEQPVVVATVNMLMR
jgi:acyl-coenzyme A thioesterase PaaI-like protein